MSERDSLTGGIERLRSWPITAGPSRGGPIRISWLGPEHRGEGERPLKAAIFDCAASPLHDCRL